MSYRVMYTTNVERNLLKRIYHLSEELKVRPNILLEQAITEYLEKHENPESKSKNDIPHVSVQ
jgi:predicted transcriptional regulator